MQRFWFPYHWHIYYKDCILRLWLINFFLVMPYYILIAYICALPFGHFLPSCDIRCIITCEGLQVLSFLGILTIKTYENLSSMRGQLSLYNTVKDLTISHLKEKVSEPPFCFHGSLYFRTLASTCIKLLPFSSNPCNNHSYQNIAQMQICGWNIQDQKNVKSYLV